MNCHKFIITIPKMRLDVNHFCDCPSQFVCFSYISLRKFIDFADKIFRKFYVFLLKLSFANS